MRTQNPGGGAPSASPLSSKVESASRVGRFPDFRVVACARLPPAALGRSDIKCASAHRIQWRDRGLGPAHSCARLPLPSNPLARAPTGIPLFRCYCVYPSTTADYSQDSDEHRTTQPVCDARALTGTHARLAGDSRATRSRWSQSPDGLRIYGLRCQFVLNCPSSWPFDMRSYYERVFPDGSRIRTMVDAYRYVCPHKSG